MAGPMFSANWSNNLQWKREQQEQSKQQIPGCIQSVGVSSLPLQRKTAGAYMLGFSSYNFQHFSREILQEHSSQASFAGPEPGERAPDFKADTLDGERVRLSDFHGKKNVLLVFGSATCPMTAASIAGINELYDRFRGDDIEFLFIYVREAHPGEQLSAHRTDSHKQEAARRLRDEEEIEMPIVVDDLRGSIHRKYSRLPNPAFLVDKSGRVAFRTMWSKPDEIESAIEELLELQKERR